MRNWSKSKWLDTKNEVSNQRSSCSQDSTSCERQSAMFWLFKLLMTWIQTGMPCVLPVAVASGPLEHDIRFKSNKILLPLHMDKPRNQNQKTKSVRRNVCLFLVQSPSRKQADEAQRGTMKPKECLLKTASEHPKSLLKRLQ